MSYLNSILSSIGNNEQPPKAATVKHSSRTASPLDRPHGTSVKEETAIAAASAKRKAPNDEELSDKADKVPRLESQRVPTLHAATASIQQNARPGVNGSSMASAARLNQSGQPRPKPIVKTNPAATSGNSPATPSVASPAPKKGSFADIMARAAAAQQASSTKPSLGTIRHKTTEKPSAEVKKARLDQLKNKKGGIKGVESGSRPSSRSQSPEKAKHGAGSAKHSNKAAVESGYRGTMRPSNSAAPAYKGTMRGGPAPTKPQSRDQARHSRYADESDDDDDEDSEGYDDLSDMEAGMDEVDEEEAASLAFARREDLQAKREEENHRREKDRRKRLLQSK